MAMHIENDPTPIIRKILYILAHSSQPKPIKEIAQEIAKPYDDTQQYLNMMRRLWPITYSDLPNGDRAVEIVTGPHFPGRDV